MALLKTLGELPDPQVALASLRYCASSCKLVHSLRVTQHRIHKEALQSFDQTVWYCVDAYCCFSFSDEEWTLDA